MRFIKLTLAALLLFTPIMATTSVANADALTTTRSIKLTVNGKSDTLIKYGEDVEVRWSPEGVTDCSIQPNYAKGSKTRYTLSDVKETTQIDVHCTDGHAKAVVQVLPPTFSYLRGYLASLNKKHTKHSAQTRGIIDTLNRAEKKYSAGDVSGAKRLLDKTVDSVRELAAKRKISKQVATNYAADVTAFVGSWGKSVPSVSISSDGCIVTAKASLGDQVEYGAHDGIWMRGFDATKALPEGGVFTSSTGGSKGMTSYGYITSGDGKLLAGSSAVITADTCPAPEGVEEPEPEPEPEPPVNGGYPAAWADAPMSSVIDSWGFYNRQAASYAAFKVADSGRYMPYGFGNPKDWPAKASSAGIPVGTTPKVGDVAISTVGLYGHAMYVEEILSNGGIRVSQYNATLTGAYSESTFTTVPSNLQFIHFPSAN